MFCVINGMTFTGNSMTIAMLPALSSVMEHLEKMHHGNLRAY